MTPASYYLWKWADNDLPGKPNEVFAELMGGRMHPALQPFDPTPILAIVEKEMVAGRQRREEWTVTPCAEPGSEFVRFIAVHAPTLPGEADCPELWNSAWRLRIAWYHEQEARLALGVPKHNYMYYIGLPWVYEVTEEELPVLLRQIPTGTQHPFAILTDHRQWFVQTFTDGKRYIVEWRENHSFTDWEKYGQWIAGHRPVNPRRTRVKSVDGKGPPCRTSELLGFAETLEIFRAFLRGEPKPVRYHWRAIKDELK